MTPSIPDERSVRCAIYCRISLARFGDTIKVDDQERVCRDLAAAKGWTVSDAHIYKDNSTSAWKRDRRRPGWDSMLEAIRRGDVHAIIVFHGDRLIRQPWDLELLLNLADERHIQLASPTGHRNLSSEDDRFILRIEAAAACREVAATSRRLKHMFDRRAEQGFVRSGGRGGRAFGYEVDGLTVREAEAEVIREVADRILRGEPVNAICRDLNRRGIRTTPGNAWTHTPLTALMRRPRLAGLVQHRGRTMGKAAWPAILDRETWESVVARLSGKAETLTYAPSNAARYLLSGLAVCGSCRKPLMARQNVQGPTRYSYGCVNRECRRKMFRSVAHLDAFVEAAAVELLADPRVRQALAPKAAGHLIEELQRLEERRVRKIAEFADDDSPLAADVLRVTVGKIDARIGEIRAELSRASASHVLDGLFGISADEFADLPLSRRRAAVRVLLRVVVGPARRGPGFDASSVRLLPAWVADEASGGV